MNRFSRTLIVGVLLAAASAASAACGGGAPGGGGSPTPDGSAVIGGTPTSAPTSAPSTAADPWILSTAGIGPYHLGARSSDLNAAGLLGTSSPINPAECPDLYSVQATGIYEGTLLLIVRHTVLVEIGTAGGGPVRSPEGVRVGDEFASALTAYGSGATSVTSPSGLPGLVVTSGERVLLFTGHPIRSGIGWFAAGYADHTRDTFVSGAQC